jgi:hypothetical protein
MIQELKVNIKDTNAYKRRLISAPDDRPSAQYVGSVGALVIGLVILGIVLRPKKKNVCLLSPDRPYFFTPTLKLFIGKFLISWKFCLFLEPNGIISSITVESVCKTVNKYKNITNNNYKKTNSLNFKIKKILKKK